MARSARNPGSKATPRAGDARDRNKAAKPAKGSPASKGAAPKAGHGSTSLLLRGLDADVVEVLRARAKRAGRSLQQELHLALRRDARRNFDEAAATSSAWRNRLKGRDLPDSTELLREGRDR